MILALVLALLAVRSGCDRFLCLHLKHKRMFAWKQHVRFGTWAALLWCLGAPGGSFRVLWFLAQPLIAVHPRDPRLHHVRYGGFRPWLGPCAGPDKKTPHPAPRFARHKTTSGCFFLTLAQAVSGFDLVQLL